MPPARARSSKQVSDDSDDDDFQPRGSGGGGKRKRRNAGRGAVSCLQCRHSKVSCDLGGPEIGSPCSKCVAKGEGASCTLTNRLFYEDLENAPAPKLKSMVDRLETMLLRMSATASTSGSASPRMSASSTGSPSISLGMVAGASSPSVASSPHRSRFEANSTHDSEVISRLVLGGSVDSAHISPGVDLQALVAEIQYSDSTRQHVSLPHLADPSSANARPPADSFSSLFQIMPTQHQARRVISAFFSHVDPFLHVLHRPTFDTQCLYFWETGVAPDPNWLATFLCVAGTGLLMMTDEEASTAQVPEGDGKDLLARSWLDGAIKALSSGDFTRKPTLESTRAIVLLNHFWIFWQGGDHLQAAITFNAGVIASAFELELHRDPDEITGFTPLEAEERRRVFWALFSLDTISRALLAKSYTPFDPTTISVRLPSHLSDEAFTTSGDFEFSFTPPSGPVLMPSVIAVHSISIAICKTSKLLASIKKPLESDVLRIHEDLQAIQVSLASTDVTMTGATDGGQPSVLFTEQLGEPSVVPTPAQALLSFAFVRLHRSCLVGGIADSASADSAWHRAICLQHSSYLLRLLDPIYSFVSVEQLFAATASVSAAITIAVDLLDTPYSSAADDARTQLSGVQATFEVTPWNSSLSKVHARGAIILRHLTLQVKQHQTTGLTAAGAFAGVGHSRHPSESSASTSFVGTAPSEYKYLVASQATRRSSDQSSFDAYLSPLRPSDQSLATPYSESFATESYYPLSDDFRGHGRQHRSIKHEVLSPCPLLMPWLASTQFSEELDTWGIVTPDQLSYSTTPLFA